jgi:hypothetical protein
LAVTVDTTRRRVVGSKACTDPPHLREQPCSSFEVTRLGGRQATERRAEVRPADSRLWTCQLQIALLRCEPGTDFCAPQPDQTEERAKYNPLRTPLVSHWRSFPRKGVSDKFCRYRSGFIDARSPGIYRARRSQSSVTAFEAISGDRNGWRPRQNPIEGHARPAAGRVLVSPRCLAAR